ncbi:uncharacterized protein LOC135398606 [Ornithodoros turicata]|uniref:uncharacterized protein LOC135398606 n=1 Tax=Ornithodoros turicata TaxID=34597 RepID=UPI00313A0ACF
MAIRTQIPGIKRKADLPPMALKQLALSYLEEAHPSAKKVFTDGSTTALCSTSAVYGEDISKSYKLSHTTSSTAAELHGILKALTYIKTCEIGSWIICSDSKAALQGLCLPDMTHLLHYKIHTDHSDVIERGHRVELQWVPAHCGIDGNELADKLAKEVLSHQKRSPIPFTKGDAVNLLNSKTKVYAKKLWLKTLRSEDYIKHIDPELKYSIPVNIKREYTTLIHRIRLGVLPTNSVLFKQGKADSPDCSTCMLPDTTHHVITQCKKFSKEREQLDKELRKLSHTPLTFAKIMGNWNTSSDRKIALSVLCDFLKETQIVQKN